MGQMVVLEARVGTTVFWAWCRVGGDVGLNEITYTRADGVTPVTDLTPDPVLGKVLFTIPPPEPDVALERRVVWTDEFLLGPNDDHPNRVAITRLAAVDFAPGQLVDVAGEIADRLRVDVRPVWWRRGWSRVFVTLYSEDHRG